MLATPLTRLIAAACFLSLAACTATSQSTGMVSAPSAPVDPSKIDLASSIIVFDLPAGLQTEGAGSILRMPAASFSRNVDARLIRADAGDVITSLPPPAAGHTYFMFEVDERDAAALRTLTQTPGPQSTPQVLPAFCATGAVNPTTARFSVFAVGLSGHVRPLVTDQLVSEALVLAGRGDPRFCA